MEEFIGELTRHIITGIISISSVFVSTISGVNPEFSSPKLNIEGRNIYISTQLINYSTEEFDHIFSSGIPIRINFEFELFSNSTSLIPLTKKKITREIQYDNLNHQYLLHFFDENKKVKYKNLELSKKKLFSLSKIKFKISQLPEFNNSFILVISATPEYIVLTALDERIDLLLYWNLTRPKATIEITKDMFIE